MTERCPTCNGTGLATAPPDPVEQLRAWLLEHGHVVTADDCTDTRGAAAARGVTPGWLRQMRCYYTDDTPPFRRSRGRCSYRLADLVRA